MVLLNLPDLPDQCRLHFGLHLLADSAGRVPYNLEMLVEKIFQGEDPGIYPMLQCMAGWNFLTITDKFIILKRWPQTKPKTKPREENLAQVFSQVGGYHPLRDSDRAMQQGVGQSAKFKKGLVGAVMNRDWLVFAKKWPFPLKEKDKANSQRHWIWLTRTRNLPPLSVLLYTLSKHPPENKSHRMYSWFTSRFWLAYWKPQHASSSYTCPHCGDERRMIKLVDGFKKAVDCEYCGRKGNEAKISSE